VNSTLATFTPEVSRDLFMNSGDKLTVALHDNANGLVATITDAKTGEVGSAARHKRHRRSAPPHPLRVLGSIDDVGSTATSLSDSGREAQHQLDFKLT